MNNTNKDSVSIFFEEGIELSNFNIHNYTPCRGDIEGQSFMTASEVVTQTYNAVQFSPHAITHFDLPGCLDEHELELAEGYDGIGKIGRLPKDIVKILEHYSKVSIKDTVILDISEKIKNIQPFLDHNTGFLFGDMSSTHFTEMMQSLEIRKNEDILRLASEKDLLGKLVIFKTEWEKEFNVFYHNLNNPFFELRHPYLTHPFLSYETIKWLVKDMKVVGIGGETCGIDNPAYFSKPHFLPPYATEYYDSIDPPFRPVIVLLLTNSCYFINHIVNLDQIKQTKCFGRSCIMPVSLGTYDANMVKILFKEGT